MQTTKMWLIEQVSLRNSFLIQDKRRWPKNKEELFVHKFYWIELGLIWMDLSFFLKKSLGNTVETGIRWVLLRTMQHHNRNNCVKIISVLPNKGLFSSILSHFVDVTVGLSDHFYKPSKDFWVNWHLDRTQGDKSFVTTLKKNVVSIIVVLMDHLKPETERGWSVSVFIIY